MLRVPRRWFLNMLNNFARTEEPRPPQPLSDGLSPPVLTEYTVRSWWQSGTITSLQELELGTFLIEGDDLSFIITVPQEVAGEDQNWEVLYNGNMYDGNFRGTARYGEAKPPLAHVVRIVLSIVPARERLE